MGHEFRSTMSTEAQITDRDAFEEWASSVYDHFEYRFPTDETVEIYAREGIFLERNMSEFAEELSQFLVDPIKITTVGFMEACHTYGTEVRIEPDGSFETTHIGQ